MPETEVPETVAMVLKNVVVVWVQEYIQVKELLVSVMNTSETIPDSEMVGVGVIAWEKVAVMVTTSEFEISLSKAEEVKVTVMVVAEPNKFKKPLFNESPLDWLPIKAWPIL